MSQKATESWEEQLDSCLNEIRRVCGSRLAPDALVNIREQSIPIFQKYQAFWPEVKDKVLRSSTFIGIIAIDCAALGESAMIKEEHVWAAIAAVRPVCTATDDQVRMKWCPDPRAVS
jgi:hypothetical protein